MNNFKELEKELMSNNDFALNSVKNNIEKSRGVFQLIGDFIELFFPKMLDVLSGMAGGKEDNTTSKYPHEQN